MQLRTTTDNPSRSARPRFNLRNPWVHIPLVLALAGGFGYIHGFNHGYNRAEANMADINRESLDALQREVGFWKQKNPDGRSRLIQELHRFLSAQGYIPEKGILDALQKKLDAVEVGKNAFVVSGRTDLAGQVLCNRLFVNTAILSRAYTQNETLYRDRLQVARNTVAHEMWHLFTAFPFPWMPS